MAHQFGQKAPLEDQQVDDLLEDLELRCTTGVATARGMAAVRRRVGVTIRPADVNLRKTFAVAGVTVELRREGMSCMSPEPVMVGSAFHLSFDRTELDVAPVLAICDRCWMLSDTSFEVRFLFATPTDLPAIGPATS